MRGCFAQFYSPLSSAGSFFICLNLSPESTKIVCPVIAGDFARNATDSATSLADGPNPRGDSDWTLCRDSASRMSLVRTCPGATEFILTLGARSSARAEVRPCKANLEPCVREIVGVGRFHLKVENIDHP